MAQHSDLVVDSGATFHRQFKFNSPWDLTGCEVYLNILSRRSSPIVFELQVDSTTGTVDLYLSPEQTMQFRRFNNHRYYLDCRYPGGDVIRVITGRVISSV